MGPDWLVIATYSGDMEETIDGVREVLSLGGSVVGICSEAKCRNFQRKWAQFVEVPSGQMPRSAFGHILVPTTACWALGILKRPDSEEISQMPIGFQNNYMTLIYHIILECLLAFKIFTREGVRNSFSNLLRARCMGFCCQLNENSAKFV